MRTFSIVGAILTAILAIVVLAAGNTIWAVALFVGAFCFGVQAARGQAWGSPSGAR